MTAPNPSAGTQRSAVTTATLLAELVEALTDLVFENRIRGLGDPPDDDGTGVLRRFEVAMERANQFIAMGGVVEGPDPHEDTPHAEVAAHVLGAKWHEHPIDDGHGHKYIWKHRHETAPEAASALPSLDVERLRAALERLLAVALTEEEDWTPQTQDEWIAAIKQANEALS